MCHDQYDPLEGAPAFVLDSGWTSTMTSSVDRPLNIAVKAQPHFTQVSYHVTSTVRTDAGTLMHRWCYGIIL